MAKKVKKQKNHPLLKKIGIHLGVFIALCVAIGAGFFIWLNIYTHHDEKEIVPDIKLMELSQASDILQQKSLVLEVIDSLYSDNHAPGSIVDQDPIAGSFVKKGRKVYVTINAIGKKLVSLPDVVDMSLRQATVQLQALGFVIDSVVYQPSDYRDLVLGVSHNDTVVQAGDRLIEKSRIYLLVGDGGIVMPLPTDSLAQDSLSEVDGLIEELLQEDVPSDEVSLEEELLFE